MDFSRSCIQLHNQVRGLQPWPGTYFDHAGGAVKVFAARPREDVQASPGQVLPQGPGGGLLVADKDLTPQWVHEHVPDLLADHERLAEFGRKAWEYGIRNAAEIMARHVLQLAEPSK